MTTAMRWIQRLPAHVINGVTVALGVAVIHLGAAALFGAAPAQWLTSGAIFASLADQPGTVARSWRRVVATGLLGCLAALVVLLLAPYRVALGAGVAAIVFVATLTLAWGARAGPMSFAPVLAIVFSMALPPDEPVGRVFAAHLAGAAAYVVWALATTALLQRRYRTLALANAALALGELLRRRAAVLATADGDALAAERQRAWVRQEGVLAERLQVARDMVFSAADTARSQREAAILLRLIDLRDLLIAGMLDLDRFGAEASGQRWRIWLAARLEELADRLAQAQAQLRGSLPAAVPGATTPADTTSPVDAAADDAAARLGPALLNRVAYLRSDTDRIAALCRGGEEPLPLTRAELRLFVAPEGWPLRALRDQASLASPVLRHALRAALALGCAYAVALVLPWASHPQWLVLSVAVVLRGNFEQTLSRRNVRVLGTALGCIVVMGLARWPSPPLMTATFLIAVGLAHGFALERYLVTALAATVMSLLQAHLANPTLGFPVAERLADTLLGAALAWGFSYVLPAWERRALPKTVERAVRALRGYAKHALGDAAEDASAQRIARRQAYDALVAVGMALQRGAAEPQRVRPPLAELTRFLDFAQRLMAHLSMVRLTRSRGGVEADHPELQTALRRAQAGLQRRLGDLSGAGAGAAGEAPPALLLNESPPETEPATDLLPWLLWRLRMTGAVAAQVSQAAREALAALDRGRGAA